MAVRFKEAAKERGVNSYYVDFKELGFWSIANLASFISLSQMALINL